jgi:enoyl-CoA hydratase
VHGSHRIVTERTRLAMPETGIGFFPDVGVTLILSQRAPGEVGIYIGLTGVSLGAGDAIYAGFADAYMPADRLDALVAALASLPAGCDGPAVNGVIEGLRDPAPPAGLAAHRAVIDATFAADTVEGIIAALGAEGSAFAQDSLAALGAKSPSGLKVALSLLRAARGGGSLRDCLAREYTAARIMLDWPDFREGVRAAVIDKDRNPKWMPATLAEVILPPLHPDTALFA